MLGANVCNIRILRRRLLVRARDLCVADCEVDALQDGAEARAGRLVDYSPPPTRYSKLKFRDSAVVADSTPIQSD